MTLGVTVAWATVTLPIPALFSKLTAESIIKQSTLPSSACLNDDRLLLSVRHDASFLNCVLPFSALAVLTAQIVVASRGKRSCVSTAVSFLIFYFAHPGKSQPKHSPSLHRAFLEHALRTWLCNRNKLDEIGDRHFDLFVVSQKTLCLAQYYHNIFRTT